MWVSIGILCDDEPTYCRYMTIAALTRRLYQPGTSVTGNCIFFFDKGGGFSFLISHFEKWMPFFLLFLQIKLTCAHREGAKKGIPWGVSGRTDINASDTARYGLCSVVASRSCHRHQRGSWCLCLWRVVLCVALWDRRRPVSVSPNIWHRFSQSCG